MLVERVQGEEGSHGWAPMWDFGDLHPPSNFPLSKGRGHLAVWNWLLKHSTYSQLVSLVTTLAGSQQLEKLLFVFKEGKPSSHCQTPLIRMQMGF